MEPCALLNNIDPENDQLSSSRRRKRSAPQRIELVAEMVSQEKKPALDILSQKIDTKQLSCTDHESELKLVTSCVKREQQLALGSDDFVKKENLLTGQTTPTSIPTTPVNATYAAALNQTLSAAAANLLSPSFFINTGGNPLLISNDSNNNLGSNGSSTTLSSLMQALQHQLTSAMTSNLTSPFGVNQSLFSPTMTGSSIGLSNGGSTGSELAALLRYLPPPSPTMPAYLILYSQYIAIGNQFQGLIQLIDQYKAGLQHAVASAALSAKLTNHQQQVDAAASLLSTPENNNLKQESPSPVNFSNQKLSLCVSPPVSVPATPERKDRISPPTTPVSMPPSSNGGSPGGLGTWRAASNKASNGVKVVSKKPVVAPNGPLPGKKTTFRGTSETENLVDPNFEDISREANMIQLSESFPDVLIPREAHSNIISKSSKSATRIIRLLMKYFFSQEDLAASSLSGEGIYKKRLDSNIVDAIKSFIRRRHPNLKNGSISLCMTDVCVQARRVANNQRSRGPRSTPTLNSNIAEEEGAISLSRHVIAPLSLVQLEEEEEGESEETTVMETASEVDRSGSSSPSALVIVGSENASW